MTRSGHAIEAYRTGIQRGTDVCRLRRLPAAQREVVLDVANMSCPACPYIIEQTLKKVTGVREVEVSYEAKRARVVFDDAVTTPGASERSHCRGGIFRSTLREGGS